MIMMLPAFEPIGIRGGGCTRAGLITSRSLAWSQRMPHSSRPVEGSRIPPKCNALRRFLPWIGLLALALQNGLMGASPPSPAGLQGITEPVEDVLLSTAVAGTVAVVNVKEGTQVKKGSVLMELDKARETLDVSRRRITRDLLASEAERTRQLFRSSSAVPKEELDKKEAEAASAAVEYEIAQELLRLKLVVSPIDGVVVDVPFAVGEACQALQAVARVVNNSRIRFVCHVPPGEAAGVVVGQAVTLEIMGNEGTPQHLPGNVTYIAPVVDAASGLLRVAAEFPNPEAKVRPGQTGRLQPANRAR
jgi:membrane fusion protein (multidrug efflux system)